MGRRGSVRVVKPFLIWLVKASFGVASLHANVTGPVRISQGVKDAIYRFILLFAVLPLYHHAK